jgi:hypothetical protein
MSFFTPNSKTFMPGTSIEGATFPLELPESPGGPGGPCSPGTVLFGPGGPGGPGGPSEDEPSFRTKIKCFFPLNFLFYFNYL